MKRVARIAMCTGAAFLAFAPPGTLIFCGMLVLGWVGDPWLFAGGLAGLLLIGFGVWRWRRRCARRDGTAEPADPS